MRATTPPTWLEAKSGAPGSGIQGKKDGEARQAPSRTSWTGCVRRRQGPPGEVQGPSAALRGDGRRGRAHSRKRSETSRRSRSRPGPRLAHQGHRGHRPSHKGYRRPRPHRQGLSFSHAPQRRDRRRDRPVTASGKTDPVQDHASWAGGTAGFAGTVEVGDTVQLISYVDQSRGGIDPKQDAVGGQISDGLRLQIQHRQRTRSRPGPTSVELRLQGPRPAEARQGRAVRR